MDTPITSALEDMEYKLRRMERRRAEALTAPRRHEDPEATLARIEREERERAERRAHCRELAKASTRPQIMAQHYARFRDRMARRGWPTS